MAGSPYPGTSAPGGPGYGFAPAMVLLCATSLTSAGMVACLQAQASQPTLVATLKPVHCDCQIELTKLISLSDSLHPGLFAYSPLVMRDSRGLWYATSNTDGLKQVGVFDQRGGLKKVLGNRGEGPGEFGHINHIVVGSGDTLYVYDHSLLRRTVFDPDHEFVRTERLPAFSRQIVPLPPGRMIVNSTIATRERVGWPLHIVAADGTILQSFGADPPVYRPDDAELQFRAITLDAEGGLWVASTSAYQMSIYAEVGARYERTDRQYKREVEWFQPMTESSYSGKPEASVMHIAFTGQDPTLLWVLIDLADAEWSTDRQPTSPVRSTKALGDSLYDSILEVIDVRDGLVLASERYDTTLSRLTFQGLIPVLRIDESTNVWMDVFTPTLHRR